MKVIRRDRPWLVNPRWKDVPCSSRVIASEFYEKHTSRRPVTCVRQSTFTIDDQPYCTIHAGILALEHLLKENKE